VKKIFVVLIGALMFFSFDSFANYAIGLATGDAVCSIKSDNDIEVYKKEIDNLKIELNECKKKT